MLHKLIIFKKPISQKYFWATSATNLLPRTFKNHPIWSHWGSSKNYLTLSPSRLSQSFRIVKIEPKFVFRDSHYFDEFEHQTGQKMLEKLSKSLQQQLQQQQQQQQQQQLLQQLTCVWHCFVITSQAILIFFAYVKVFRVCWYSATSYSHNINYI